MVDRIENAESMFSRICSLVFVFTTKRAKRRVNLPNWSQCYPQITRGCSVLTAIIDLYPDWVSQIPVKKGFIGHCSICSEYNHLMLRLIQQKETSWNGQLHEKKPVFFSLTKSKSCRIDKINSSEDTSIVRRTKATKQHERTGPDWIGRYYLPQWKLCCRSRRI